MGAREWLRRRRKRVYLSLASSLVLIPGPALAYSVDQTFGPSPTPGEGYGNYNGTLFFSGARAFYWTIYVQDICPGDYVGVSYFFYVNRKSDGSVTYSPPKAWDTDGCGNNVIEGTGTITREWNIGEVKVAACWTNDGDLCWSQPLGGISGAKDNPYT